MHTRRRGKSGSTKPIEKRLPEWLGMTSEQLKQKIIELRGKGMSSSMIGIILRDTHGIPSTKMVTGKRVMQIVKEEGTTPTVPDDMRDLIIKALRLRRHLETNKKDQHNKRSLQLTESKIRRLQKYYRRSGVLPMDWKYDPATAEMFVTA